MTTNTLSLLEQCLHVLDKEIFDNTPEQAKLMEDLEAAIAAERSKAHLIPPNCGELNSTTAKPSQVDSQEPVGYIGGDEEHGVNSYVDAHFVKVTGGQFPFKNPIPVYTSPQLKPLSDEEIDIITNAQWGESAKYLHAAYRTYARAIEAIKDKKA